jgi:excisionase family DNA binding protein
MRAEWRETERQPLAVGIAEAARMIGISRRALEYRIAAGQLRTVRIGRRRLILVSELRRFLARDWPPVRLRRNTTAEGTDGN